MHTATRNRRPALVLALGSAMAAALLAGCASNAAPRADVSASAAQRELARGHATRAVEHAEAAVAADPHNPAYRLVLGNAYLDAGRFASAEAAISDAMALGDNSPRAALSLALAQIAQAKYADAATLLNQWEGQIAKADLGLALSLAGQPERGIHIMSNAIRNGENTVKMRQNLAYAYAMAGRWREARLMAAQDVPAGEVGARMEQWAAMARADAYQQRIASLLDVPAGVRDAGQPVHLALANTPSVEQLASEALMPPAATGELPSLAVMQMAPEVAAAPDQNAPEPAPASFEQAFTGTTLAQAAPAGSRFVSNPVVQAVPGVQAAPARQAPASASRQAAAAPAAASAGSSGTHLVQLGSFLSEQGARRAWGIYVSRYPELARQEMVLTQAVVNGRRFWRVSAGGFDQRASRAMCGRVRASGDDGCISWAAASPLPGTVDSGVRLARR